METMSQTGRMLYQQIQIQFQNCPNIKIHVELMVKKLYIQHKFNVYICVWAYLQFCGFSNKIPPIAEIWLKQQLVYWHYFLSFGSLIPHPFCFLIFILKAE